MKTLISTILILLALACTLPIGIKIFYPHQLTLIQALAFHAASALLFANGLYLLTRHSKTKVKKANLWWSFGLTACIILPLYGIYIVLIIFVLQKILNKKPPPIEEDVITVQDIAVFGKAKKRSRQLELLDRLDIEPFMDIFRKGQSKMKKSAIELLGNLRSHQAIHILKQALMDSDIEVRLFAAGVLGRFDDEYAKSIKKISARLNTNPQDSKTAHELVDVYQKYAQSGLLEARSQAYYYQESLKVLDSLPEDFETNSLKSHILFHLGELDKSHDTLNKCLKEDENNPQCNKQHLEILFAKREYKKMVSVLQGLKNKKALDLSEEVIQFWS
jgi:tetratricopeptide (TPR) repeat protein